MFNNARHGFCSEFYTVEKSIEVVVKLRDGDTRIKIDALKDERAGKFSTKEYREELVTLQPTCPQTGGSYDRQPEDFRIWVDYDLPWTNRDTADAALEQALGFLKERCSKSK
ncbi:MAG: hypothetical protein V3U93_06825 [Alphaproteobacteria bacterium]